MMRNWSVESSLSIFDSSEVLNRGIAHAYDALSPRLVLLIWSHHPGRCFRNSKLRKLTLVAPEMDAFWAFENWSIPPLFWTATLAFEFEFEFPNRTAIVSNGIVSFSSVSSVRYRIKWDRIVSFWAVPEVARSLDQFEFQWPDRAVKEGGVFGHILRMKWF